jgi:DNA repair ATPase RecN
MNKEDEKLIEELKELQHAGGCGYTLEKAYKILRDGLSDKLTESENASISTALGHVETGEGRDEFDDNINSIIKRIELGMYRKLSVPTTKYDWKKQIKKRNELNKLLKGKQ